MLGLGLLIASLVANYWQHRHNRPTMCSTVRSKLPEPITETAIAATFAWLVLHIHRGYIEKEAEKV